MAKATRDVDRLLASAEQAPEADRPAFDVPADQLRDLRARSETVTRRIEAAQKKHPLVRRLATIPGPGPIASRSFAATTPDVAAFRSAGLFRLARTSAEAPFERRQAAARSDLEGWKHVSSTPALSWSHGVHPEEGPSALGSIVTPSRSETF